MNYNRNPYPQPTGPQIPGLRDENNVAFGLGVTSHFNDWEQAQHALADPLNNNGPRPRGPGTNIDVMTTRPMYEKVFLPEEQVRDKNMELIFQPPKVVNKPPDWFLNGPKKI